MTAQKPYWIDELPSSQGENYYYRVTQADGRTPKDAYAEAFAIAVLESSWRLGVAVDTHETAASMKGKIANSITVQNSQIKLSINKVCEYRESVMSNRGTTVYILWQVAKYGNVDPQFDEFTKCR